MNFRPPVRLHYAWIVAAVTFVTLLGASGFRSTPGVLIVPLQHEFGCVRATISVAVSINLVLFGFSGPVAAALTRRALERQSLVLEITEGLLADDPQVIISRLQELKQLGLRIAIDDFGTGYSALSQLQRLPIDILKIDKSFIDQLHLDSQKATLVQGIINLGESMKLDVIAEGIEQSQQAERLKAMHSPQGQGFLFSRPIHPDSMLALLRAPAAHEVPS